MIILVNNVQSNESISTHVLRHPVHGVAARLEQEVVYDHIGNQLIDPRLHRRLGGGRANVFGEDRHGFRIQMRHEYLQSLVWLRRLLQMFVLE